jgi:N-acetylglucosaminyl-diphospho-decaprenol L-rhamnosyltransferase
MKRSVPTAVEKTLTVDRAQMNSEGINCAADAEHSIALSIVIISYNARRYLRACLRSVFAVSYPWDTEVIVVDNASHDGSVALVREEFPRARLIDAGSNTGFSHANNLGFAAAKGEYLLMLNSDTELTGNALEQLVGFLRIHEDVGVVSPRLVYPDLTDQGVARRFPTPINALFGRRSLLTRMFPNNRYARQYLLSRQHRGDIPFEADWVSGACLMFRRGLLERLGGLDERFWMYWEDADFCYRAKQQAWRVFYVPAAVVIHHEGKSSGGRRDGRLIIEFNRSAYRYYRKHCLKAALHPMAVLAAIFVTMRTGISLCANAFRAKHD